MNVNRITQTDHPPDFIDLGTGNPDLELIPLGLIQKAIDKYFSTNDPRPLQYGAEAGNGYFLEALADFLTSTYQSAVDPGSLFITTGASSALDLLCTLHTQPGDVVFVEEPSYFLALRIFEDHRLQVVPIPMDDGGLDVDKLAKQLTQYQPKFLYTIPTFHNPTCRTLTHARRKKLVGLAQQHDFLILADEVYHFLSYTQEPPPPFATYSSLADQVVSINSFSKILAPGLRLGWIHAHDSLIKQLAGCGLLDSGGGMNPFSSAIVLNLLDSGDLSKNINILQKSYRERLSVMTNALDHYLPNAEYRKPHGGFFIWLQLPGKDTSRLRFRAKTFDIDFRPGELFSSENGLKEFMRISFCYYSPKAIVSGIMKLGKCLSQK